MTTTPIDSSFSSHSDDFENLNDSELSESLMYCLNGNEPLCITPNNQSQIQNNLNSTAGRSSKRPHPKPIDVNDEKSTVDYSCINPKKNHLELSAL